MTIKANVKTTETTSESSFQKETSAQETTTTQANQPQLDAEKTDSPQKESDTVIQTLPIEETTKDAPSTPFAHDINQKIDGLNEGITKLNEKFKLSHGQFNSAVDDIRSRAAVVTEEIKGVTEEINEIAESLTKTDSTQQVMLEQLDQQLKESVSEFAIRMNAFDEQFSSHHSDIRNIARELSTSYSELDKKIETLKQDSQAKLQTLFTQQEHSKRTQQALSDYLDNLQSQTNQTADNLFDLDSTMRNNETNTKQRFKKFSITGGICIACLLGLSIFQFSGLSTLKTETQASLAGLSQGLSEHKATTLSAQYNAAAIESLQSELSNQVNAIDGKHSAVSDELASLADKVTSLQLSLYGPADDGKSPQPELTIHGSTWIGAQPESHYSIQLVGVYRYRGLVSFTNSNATNLKAHDLSYNVSSYRGQDWYNLFYGNFATFSEANSALEKLPANLQKNSPWIRQIAAIKKTGVN